MAVAACLAAAFSSAPISAAEVEQAFIANAEFNQPADDLVLTMENRNSGIYAAYNKNVTINANTLTAAPEWDVMTQTPASFSVANMAGGNSLTVTTTGDILFDLDILPTADQSKNVTVSAVEIAEYTSAKANSVVSFASSSGDITFNASNGFQGSGQTYGMNAKNAESIDVSAENVSLSATGYGNATGLNITGTAGKYEVLPTSDFTAADSLHFSAKVESSTQLKGAANATAVSAQLTNSTFSGKDIVFEATSDRGTATGLVADGMTGSYVTTAEDGTGSILFHTEGADSIGLKGTDSNLTFDTDEFRVEGIGKTNVSGIEINGGNVTVTANEAYFDLKKTGATTGADTVGISAIGEGVVDITTTNDIVFNLDAAGGNMAGVIAGQRGGTTGSTGGDVHLTSEEGSIVMSITKHAAAGDGQNVYGFHAIEGGEITLDAAENVVFDKSAIAAEIDNGNYDISAFEAQNDAAIHINAGGYLSINPSEGIHGTDSAFRSQSGSILTVETHGANEDGFGVIAMAEGEMAKGVLAQDGSVDINALGGSVGLSATGGGANAFEVTGSSQDVAATIDSSDSIILSAEADGSKGTSVDGFSLGIGVNAYGHEAEAALTAANSITISSKGKNYYAYGIQTQGNTAYATLTAKDVAVSAEVTDAANYAYGFFAAGGTIDVNASNNATLTSTGTGAYAQSAGWVDISAGNDALIASNSTGAYASGGKVTIDAGHDAAIQSGSTAAFATGETSLVSVDAGNNITLEGNTGTYAKNGGQITVTADAAAKITAASFGAYAETNGQIDITTGHDATIVANTYAVYASSGSLIDISAGTEDVEGDVTLSTFQSTNASSIAAYAGGESSVTISSTGETSVYAENTGMFASNATMQVKAGTDANIYAGGIAIASQEGADYDLTAAGSATVVSLDNIAVYANTGSTIDVTATTGNLNVAALKNKAVSANGEGATINFAAGGTANILADGTAVEMLNGSAFNLTTGESTYLTSFNGTGAQAETWSSIAVKAADNIQLLAQAGAGAMAIGAGSSIELTAGTDLRIQSALTAVSAYETGRFVLIAQNGGAYITSTDLGSGVEALGGSTVTVDAGKEIQVVAQNGMGAYAAGAESAITMTTPGQVAVSASGPALQAVESGSIGVDAGGLAYFESKAGNGLVADSGASMTINAGAAANVVALAGQAISATGTDTLLTIDAATDAVFHAGLTGMTVTDGAATTINAQTGGIYVSSDKANGVELSGGSSATLTAGTVGSIIAEAGNGISVSAALSTFNLTAGTDASVYAGGNALNAEAGGALTIAAETGKAEFVSKNGTGATATGEGSVIDLSAGTDLRVIAAQTAMSAADGAHIELSALQGGAYIAANEAGNAIEVLNGATVNVDAVKEIQVSGLNGIGVLSSGTNSAVTLTTDGQTLVSASGSALQASESGSIDVNAGGLAYFESKAGNGLVGESGASMTINAGGAANVVALAGQAISAVGADTLVAIDAATDAAFHAGLTGMTVADGAVTTINAQAGGIYVSSDKANGVEVAGGSTAALTAGTVGSIIAEAGSGITVSDAESAFNLTAGTDASVYAGGNVLLAEAGGAITIDAQTGKAEFVSKNDAGLTATGEGSLIDLSAGTDLRVNAAHAAVSASEGGSIDVDAVQGGAYFASTEEGNAMEALNGSTVNVEAAKEIQALAQNGIGALANGAESSVILTTEGKVLVSASGSALEADGGSAIDVNAGDAAYFESKTGRGLVAASGSAMSITTGAAANVAALSGEAILAQGADTLLTVDAATNAVFHAGFTGMYLNNGASAQISAQKGALQITSDNVDGVVLGGGSNAVLTAGTAGSVIAEEGEGVAVSGGSDLTLKVGTDALVYAGSHALSAQGGSTIQLDAANGKAEIASTEGMGAWAAGSAIDLTAGTDIRVSGAQSAVSATGAGSIDLSAQQGGVYLGSSASGNGIEAFGGSTVTVDAAKEIQIGAQDGFGVMANGANSTVDLNTAGNAVVSASESALMAFGATIAVTAGGVGYFESKNDSGLVATDGAELAVYAGDAVNVIALQGLGVQAMGANTALTVDAGKDLVLHAGETGVSASDGASANLTAANGGLYITSDKAAGIDVSGGSTALLAAGGVATVLAEAGEGIAASNSTIDLSAGSDIAVIAEENALLAADGASIQLASESGKAQLVSTAGHGIWSNGSTVGVNVGGNATVSAFEKGIYAEGVGSTATLKIGGDALIQAGDAGVQTAGSSIDLTAGGYLRVEAEETALDAQNGLITANATGNFTAISQNGHAVNAAASTIGVTAGGEAGFASEKTAILANDNSVLTIEAGSATISSNEAGIYADAGSQVTLTLDSKATVISDGTALHAADGSSVALGNAENLHGENYAAAGTIDEFGFGTGAAIRADANSTIRLYASGSNTLFGSVWATGTDAMDATTSVVLNGSTNTVRSHSAIAGAGDLETDEAFAGKTIYSAVYAEGANTDVLINGERNNLFTYADHNNEDELERVIWAYDGADVTINGLTTISTDNYETSPNSLDIAIAAGTAVNLTDEAVNAPVADRATVTLNYRDGSSITGDVLAAYAGQIDIRGATAQDGIHITGNLIAGNNGVLNADIGNGGTLTGRIDDYGDAGVIDGTAHGSELFDPAFSSDLFKGGEVNLTMGDSSRWNVTGQSWVTRITTSNAAIGDNTAVIDLISANTDRNEEAHALTVYEFNGNAVFNMSLNRDRDLSDMLYMKNAQGEYLIHVIDPVTQADMYADGFDGLRFATVGKGSNVKFRAVTTDQGILNVEYEVGTDAYEGNNENAAYNGDETSTQKPGSGLVDGFFENEEAPGVKPAAKVALFAAMPLSDEAAADAAEGERALEEGGSTLDAVDDTTNYKLIGRAGEETSDAGRTVINMSRANYANAVYLDTLNKRQGEMRFSKGKDDGLWARVRYDSIGKKSSFDIDNTMIEVGVDSLYRKDSGEFHTGIALDYMTGDTDYHGVKGDGNIDRYGAWFYTTWLGDEGDYYDFVVKYGHLENDFTIYAKSTGEKISGDYDNEVLSASLEYGKKYQNEERWYFEPQAQVQYAYVTSDEYQTSQGSEVRLDAIHSLIGRVGVRFGKDFATEKPMTFYVRGDIMHEFLGDQDIYASDATGKLHELYENEGTWYSAGAGFSFKTTEDLYMFIEAEKVFGNSNSGTYTVSGGLKYFF